jgi:opacity protein-like surface antigen
MLGPGLLGVEADMSAQNVSTAYWHRNSYSFTEASHWLATARFRSGLAVTPMADLQPVLLYLTAGGAAAGATATFCIPTAAPACLSTPPTGPQMHRSTWTPGWTAGGGMELPIAPDITSKFEILYVDPFKTNTFTFGSASYTLKRTEAVVRAGVDYRFALF